MNIIPTVAMKTFIASLISLVSISFGQQSSIEIPSVDYDTIEVAIFPTTSLKNIIPNVFENAKEQVNFETATDKNQGSSLFVTSMKGKVIVIDPSCRLTRSFYLNATSPVHQYYIARVTAHEALFTVKSGSIEKAENFHGLPEKLFTGLKNTTQISYLEDLHKAKFTRYSLK